MKTRTNPYERFSPERSLAFPPEPDALHLEHGQQRITLIRDNHSYLPRYLDYGLILREWDTFTFATSPESRVVLGEGKSPPLINDSETSFSLFGPPGLLRRLCERDGGKLQFWGQSNSEIFNILLKDRFDPDTLLYYATIRHDPQWQRSCHEQHTPRFQYLYNMWESYRRDFEENGPRRISFASLEETHRRLFGSPSLRESLTDPDFTLSQTTELWSTETEVQQVAVAWNILRDDELFETIGRLFEDGKSVFVEGGWLHGYALESKLKVLGTVSVNRGARVDASTPVC